MKVSVGPEYDDPCVLVRNISHKKRRATALLQLLLVLGFLASVWFSFGRNVLSPEEELSVPE